MGLYDNAGAIGGVNPLLLMNNPSLLALLQNNNVSFRGSQTSQVQSQDSANRGSISVDYATTQPDKSNAALWITGTLGAAAIIGGLAYKGGGNPIKGAKALYEKFFKSNADKASDFISQKLSNIRVIRNGKNVECFVPGETTQIAKHDDAIKHLQQYFGDSSAKDIFNVTKGKSTLNSGTFIFETGDVVTFNGDKITKIVNSKGVDITSNFFGKNVTLEGNNKTFIDNLTSYINNAKEMKEGWTKGFRTADVTREIGDNTAHIIYGGKNKPVIKELTTLKPVSVTDDAVKAWTYDHPEAKTLLGKDVFKDNVYKIPEGMKASDARITSSDGIVYHFENGEIKGISKDGKYYAKGKKECNVILTDKEEDIKTVYEQLLNGNVEKKYRKMIDMSNVSVNYVKA